MPPFRVFISSSMRGFEEYRAAMLDAAEELSRNGTFEIFLYEEHSHQAVPGKTICEAIFETSGERFDALFVFFRERVGQGVLDELDYFEKNIIPKNPECEVWWSRIECEECEPAVDRLMERLMTTYGGELPLVKTAPRNVSPHTLKGRFTAKLISLIPRIIQAAISEDRRD